ncbi:MAG: YheC/YheD family protein [Syntrophomonadaceae bacterium]|jgi:glutathione synthase/RimK-type ligase-like ATP-grasp enzyme|nr:YheC/YheD family protein [Syntrophomonadaceae bacterium]
MYTVGEFLISAKYMENLGIPDLSGVNVRVGHRIVFTKLKAVKKPALKFKYSLSPQLSETLGLNKEKKMLIRYDREENYIHLGPTIGIISTLLPFNEGETPTSVKSELIYLGRLAATLPGQIYLFMPMDINWEHETVKGYTFTGGSDKWKVNYYPLPDVIYDRIISRTAENQENVKYTKERLHKLPYLQYFNPAFLDKWEVHQSLCRNEKILPYLPETYELNEDNLDYMLKKHQFLYVKPNNGSQGRGIIRARMDSEGIIQYSVRRRGGMYKQAKNAAEFIKKTETQRGSKKYIIQQGLNLLQYNKNSFDLRIIFQKNGRGIWQSSKRFVRLAPKGSTIANLSNGGRVETSKKVLSKVLANGDSIEDKNKQIDQLCLMVAETLEKNSSRIFGELGLDIGLDKNGWPWLIEANSKPRKTTISDYSQTIMRKSFRRPLEYAAFLAGFHYYGKQ